MRLMRRPISDKSSALRAGTALTVILGLLIASCSSSPGRYTQDQDGSPIAHIDLSQIPDATPRVETRSRYGNPESYVVRGKRYYTLSSSEGYLERGTASWYGTKFHGFRTSSGETYDMYRMTAAHKTLPLPTYARVTNLDNGRSVVVKINDRGPFHGNRLIDLSYAAAAKLDILKQGTGRVEVQVIDPAPAVRQARAIPASSQPKVPASEQGGTGATPVASQEGLLYLQLGAFRERDNAQRLQDNLASSNFEGVSISESLDEQQRIYRVRIGPLADPAEAEILSRMLQDQGVASPHLVID